MIPRQTFFLLLALPLHSALAEAIDDAEGIAFFEQKIRPVLVEHCYSCHSDEAKKLKGNLHLDSQVGWERGGDSGAAVIVPGDPEASLLLRTVLHLEEDMEMPPKKPALPDAVIADLRAWILMGAPDPRDGVILEAKRADRSWWSLQALVGEFAHADIDGFIDDGLAKAGLARNPPADPRSLIRRVTYDLHGLPPSPGEVETFMRESNADPEAAHLALVDRLLASPRYGERWGRHWLDVIRFGESKGFERNVVIDNLWPFRDYVIRSINEDKPFDRFITEHLAGDVLGPDDPTVEVGTAFLVAGPYDDVGNQDVVAQANIRAATLDDMITATSGAFLGLTVNCARCHDHKFDPIPTEDYYRIRAAFEGVTHEERSIATAQEKKSFSETSTPLKQQLSGLTKELDSLEATIDSRAKAVLATRTFSRPKVDPQLTEETFPPVAARFVRFVVEAVTSDYQKSSRPTKPQSGRLTEFQIWTNENTPRNVALASAGASAEGARSAVAEDFPEAYGPQCAIDGRYGEQWFIGNPPELTITLADVETINRIGFSNAKGAGLSDKSQGATPCEYRVEVSTDGQTWQHVTDGHDREPWSPGHGLARIRQEITTSAEVGQLAALTKEIGTVNDALARVPVLLKVWAGNFAQPKDPTFVHKGGDPMKPTDPVVPASLAVLETVSAPFALGLDAPEKDRRLALAKWITDGRNPLPLRVLANRVWQYHFGTGLVDTPSDFGFLGSQPTHPELLDFLAQRLLAHGWRLKPLHREILLSKTYRQSAALRPEAAALDKDSRQLWRFPPRRLSAEEIRDTILTAAGKLQLEPMGGPGFRLYRFTQNNVCTYFPLDEHGPETWRRAVYHQNARASVVDLLTDFDLPDIAFAAPKRAHTTTPMQALTMLNHSFMLAMADSLAARVEGADPASASYHILFQREPSAEEKASASSFIASHGRAAFCRAMLNSNELLFVE